MVSKEIGIGALIVLFLGVVVVLAMLPNISDNVFVGGLDTGHNATADLTLSLIHI